MAGRYRLCGEWEKAGEGEAESELTGDQEGLGEFMCCGPKAGCDGELLLEGKKGFRVR